MPITSASVGMPKRARQAARSADGTGTNASSARLLGIHTTLRRGIPSLAVSSAATLGLFASTRWAARQAQRFAIACARPVLGLGFDERRPAATGGARGVSGESRHGTISYDAGGT